MEKLRHRISAIHRSTYRLDHALILYEKDREGHILVFLRKEAWIHLKRSIALLWLVWRWRR